MTYPQIFIFKDDLYINLKSHEVSRTSAEAFFRYLAKSLRGHLIPSCFGPHYLVNSQLYKSKILQSIRDSVQSLRKLKVSRKYFVWLPWQLFDNMVHFANNCQNVYEKLTETTNFKASK